jgi:hypothetical protein
VEEAIPGADVVATRLQLDPDDARFLASSLDRLPGSDELNRPATIDMNGKVAIRSRGSEQSQITELVLNRSSYCGPPVRINTNREFLKRAIQLGFSEIGISDVEMPLVCHELHRVHAWQPLGGGAVLEPTEGAIRIESSTVTTVAKQEPTQPATPRSIMSDQIRRNGQEPSNQARDNGHAASESPGLSLAALIQDAEALHTALTPTRSGLARLITGLRRHCKQSRLLRDTLKSIRQLKLTETVE